MDPTWYMAYGELELGAVSCPLEQGMTQHPLTTGPWLIQVGSDLCSPIAWYMAYHERHVFGPFD